MYANFPGLRDFFARAVESVTPLGTLLLLLTAALVLGHPQRILAQVDTGGIVGQVSDASGGRIPGATITLREESTGITNTVTTGSDGTYILSPIKARRLYPDHCKEGLQDQRAATH